MTRLLRGIGANALAQSVAALAQLVCVPVFVHAWGRDRLGIWLALLAWTSMLSIADFGVMAAAGNAMAVAVSRGRRPEAARLFVQTLRFVMLIAAGFGVAIVAGAVLLTMGIEYGFAIPHLRGVVTAVALALYALASLPLGTIELGFRLDGSYAAGILATSTVRFVEAVAATLVALAGSDLAGTATTLLTVRLVGTLMAAARLRRRARWLAVLAQGAGWHHLRSILRPALAVLAIPVGFALSLQGGTIAVGACLPIGAVTTFVASRTLTRVIVQALGLVTHAVMPEMTEAAGSRNRMREAGLLRLNFAVSLGLLVPGWAVLVLTGPTLVAHWTLGAVQPDRLFFSSMATAAMLHGLWLSAANLKLAVNRQGEYAYSFVFVAAASVLATLVGGRAAGLIGVGAACVVTEALMVALVVPGQLRDALQPGTILRPLEGVR